jgi:hypothetical protein
LPVDSVRILKEVGAKIAVVESKGTAASRKQGEAVTRVSGDGYSVELHRPASAPKYLTRRERFSLAHEWAHIVVEQRTGWRPVSKRQHFDREFLCNDLASRVLVPDRARHRVSFRHPVEALKSIGKIRDVCGVSWAVATRRAAEATTKVAVAELQEMQTKNHRNVLKVVWLAGASGMFDLTPNRLIRSPVHPWLELYHDLAINHRIWKLTDVGGVEWALVARRLAPGRFFGWARVTDKFSDNGPEFWEEMEAN